MGSEADEEALLSGAEADDKAIEGGGGKAAATKKKHPPKKTAKPKIVNKPSEPKTVADADAEKQPAITVPWLTKYEFTRVVSDRATMLAYGAVPFIPLPPNFAIKTNMELREVALRELRLGLLPFKLRRPLPDGTIEEVKLRDLTIPEVYFDTARMYDVQLDK